MSDLVLSIERCAYDELHAQLEAFAAVSIPAVKRRFAVSVGTTLGVLVAQGAFFALVPPLAFLVPMGLLVTLAFGFAAALRRRRLHRRVVEKLDFVAGLARLLRDDLNPRAPMRLRLDLRGYEDPSKLERTERSSAGRKKEYFSDKWLHLHLVLAEGSVVEIVRQAGVKEKNGTVVSEKRRLEVRMRPSPKRYGALGPALAEALSGPAFEGVARRFFADQPEVFRARATEAEGVVVVRVSQYDADFHPEEVRDLLACILREAARLAARPK